MTSQEPSKVKSWFIGIALIAVSPAYAADSVDLEWLLGCWQSPDGNAMEVWVRDTDTSFLGFGVSTSEGLIRSYELLRIASNAEGELTYTAYPKGQASATFTATEIGDQRVSFTNPQHDYPQKITYKRSGDDLFAGTSKLNGGGQQSFDKVKCE